MIQRRLKNLLLLTSTKTGIVSLFLLTHSVLLLMMTYTFPAITAQIKTQAFDLRPFGYSMIEAQEILQRLDQETIDLYLFPQLFLLDILYPLLLAVFLSSLMLRLHRLIGVKDSRLYFVPFLAMICDYLENTTVALLITKSLVVSEEIVQTASTFTIMKGVLTSFSWIVVVILFVTWVRKAYWMDKKQMSLE